jgi:hypothetical protein
MVSEGPTESTEELLDNLTSDAQPVCRMPSLRVSVGLVLLLGSAVAVFFAYRHGLRSDLGSVASYGYRFNAIGIGLLGVGLGGVIAALAQVVPGRESTARRAVVVVLIASVLVVGVSTFLHFFFEEAAVGQVPGPLGCFLISCGLSIVPLAVLAVVARRGVLQHPFMVAICAALGGVGLGAFVVHLCCGADAFLHVFFGHAAAPFFGALLLSPLLRFSLGRKPENQSP